MIINELGKFIMIDEIRNNATASEVFFVSRLLGNEMLSLSENWAGRIFTSQFIYNILTNKSPNVHHKFFRILIANVPFKLKSKDKVIWVTMFEPEEIKNTVMFCFNDSIKTHLYTGSCSELTSFYRNKHFMKCVEKGIDYVYIDTTLCKCNPYISTEDAIDEIKKISLINPAKKLGVVIPELGYEKLIKELVQTFPQNVNLSKTQRHIIARLGFKKLINKTCKDSAIIVFLPGLLTEDLQFYNITPIYITVGEAPTKSKDIGTVFCIQWSPLPSLMDLQVLLERIKPNKIIPIEQDAFDKSAQLPSHFKWLAKQPLNDSNEEESDDSDLMDTGEPWPDNDSIGSISFLGSENSSKNNSPNLLLPSTKLFNPNLPSTTKAVCEVSKDPPPKEVPEPIPIKTENKLPLVLVEKCVNLTKRRTRVVREKTDITFIESDDDDK